MADKQGNTFETRSVAACSAKGSDISSTSKAAAIAHAKAETARACVSFAQKEMEMKVERARVEASLDLLNIEKEAADTDGEKYNYRADLPLKPEDPKTHTAEYVLQHPKYHNSLQSMPGVEPISELDDRTPMPQQDRQDSFVPAPHHDQENDYNTPLQNTVPTHQPVKVERRTDQTPPAGERRGDESIRTGRLNDHNHPLMPHYSTPLSHNPYESQGMTNFVRFFAHRELVSTGLLQFDDRPENYRAWRTSFFNAVRGLDLSPSKEMDLLVKWLGQESAGHAKRIRAVKINQPERGLKMVWERLDQCYGSPEAIESALFKRLDGFPRISNKEFQKLKELGDLLMEVLSAKAEGDLPGLAFLDTSRGVNPIAQKLPYNLQEKWISEGTRYKQQHGVPFPPFYFFVHFVCHQAMARNDPSFNLTMFNTVLPNSEKSGPKHNNRRTPISVHKTEVASFSKAEGRGAWQAMPHTSEASPAP